MQSYSKNNLNLKFTINKEKVIITGNAKENFIYIAPKPIEKRLSYSGSALPYANEDMAFDNTKAKGIIMKGNFKIEIDYPSPHYEFCSAKMLKPYIKFYNKNENHHVVLGEPLINNRSLMELEGSPNHPRTTYGGYGSGGKN